ncbi:MAG: PAS domain-containing protein [Gammaproteobacteria bacterium]|nr:PAS domain-containing protein [Gammaproteobacteria bacterium]MBU0787793.1 PAS domain-containing protein [Gammaproteobacteria bacterium]MBU0817088.1 PAS domain-containing protein [Gammaproteobacteria bacterium]MBU1787252.1 PAS domain-containing protein [Gammaproteobacteria bacterium]
MNSAESVAPVAPVAPVASTAWRPVVLIWSITLLLLTLLYQYRDSQVENLRHNEIKRASDQIFNLTRVMQEHALRTFRAADQTLRFMVDQYQLKGSRLNLKHLTDAGVIDASLFPQVGIIDAEGIYQLSNLPITRKIDLSDRKHFTVHRDDEAMGLYISAPVLGRASKEWSIQLTRRINHPDGRFAGVGVVSLRASYFSNFYSEFQFPKDAVAVLVGRDMVFRVRTSNGNSTYGEQAALDSALFTELAKGRRHASFIPVQGIDGIRRYISYQRTEAFPMVVMAGLSQRSIEESLNASRAILDKQAIGLGLLLLLLASVLTYYICHLENLLRQRSRLLNKLQAGEERLAMAIRGGSMGVWDWHLSQQTFDCNAQLPALLGYQPEELIFSQNVLMEMLHPDDAQQLLQRLHLHLKGHLPNLEEIARFRNMQGGWEWLKINSQVTARNTANRAERLSGTVQNVTARLQALRALQASESRWNRAISGSNEGIWDLDLESDALYVSARLLSLLNLKPKKSHYTLRRWRAWIHPESVGPLTNSLQELLSDSTGHLQLECQIRDQTGEYKWMLLRGCTEHDATGKPTRISGSANDVTNAHLAQRLLHERTAQLDSILEVSTTAFVTFGNDCCVSYVNPAFHQITGLQASSVVGMHEDQLLERMNLCVKNSSMLLSLELLRKRALQGLEEKKYLVELHTPTHKVIEYKLYSLHNKATGVSHVLSLSDITQESMLEQMKSEFLSTAAHEMRTPMANIMGYSEILLQMELDPQQKREFLEVIHTQSERMRDILDELLDLSRIEARRGLDFVFEEIHLKELVEDIVNSFSLPMDRTLPSVELPDICVYGDLKKTRQSILNTLSNAYKYSTVGTAVRIVAADGMGENKQSLTGICIVDQGIGMSADELKRVFERFYRADTSGRIPGTGLGMSIVKEIMEIQGGTVVIESQKDQGSKVSLLFPSLQTPTQS